MINWIKPEEFLPGIESTVVLLKGEISAYLKNKYVFLGHKLQKSDWADEGELKYYRDSINLQLYFIVIAKIRPWNGAIERPKTKEFLFTKIAIKCCDDDSWEGKHHGFLREIGATRENIGDFVSAHDLKIRWHNIEGWSKI